MTEGRVPGVLWDFVDLVGDGAYWESHEILERAWRRTGSDFLQGLILYVSAFVHLKRENAHGVRAQLEKALHALDGYPDAYLGFDVAGVREHVRATLRIVGHDASPDPDWAGRVSLPALDPRPGRIRGDEPELDSF